MSDIDRKQLAAELGVSFGWVRERTAKHLLPCQRYGRHIRFTPEQVAAIKAMHQQAPVTVIPLRVRRRAA